MLLKEAVRYNLLKQLPIESLTKNDLDFIYETEVGTIKSFPVSDVDWGGENLGEYFELLYELEYKYNMGRKVPFEGNPKRGENILKIFGAKLEELIDVITPTFIRVFEEWIEAHNIDDPSEMYRARYDEFSAEEIMNAIISEYGRYVHGKYGGDTQNTKYYYEILNNIEQNIDDYPTLKEVLSDDEFQEMYRNDMRETLNNDGLEEFNERYDTEFDNEDVANDYIDEYVEDIELAAFFPEPSMLTGLYDFNSVAEEIYTNQILPAWENNWAIENTLENNKEIFHELENIDNYPISERTAILNKAINATHQTGDMMDYYENEYQINKDMLDDLSNQDVSQWNKEMYMLGFNMGKN